MKRKNKIAKGLFYGLKRLIISQLAALYKILYLFLKPKGATEKKYRVSLCAIFKNEEPYLKEWIEFHRLVGIDHFYLYNNFSTDHYYEVLKPYIDDGVAELIEWPYEQGQLSAYEDCIERCKEETAWIGFIDLDEFIVPNACDSIVDFLKKFENKPVVLFYWKMFGSSGLYHRDKNNLVIEDFILSWKDYARVGKIMFNTKFEFIKSKDKQAAFFHFMWAKYNGIKLPPVNVFNSVCIKNYCHIKKEFPVQINHYYTKSYKEYLDKISRGDAFYADSLHKMEAFFNCEKKAVYADYHAYKYLNQMKLRMR